ncbi:prolyl oligopeptidase family serine peptidase [Goodfellowiella coeruleoviolacea]|uniref:prolyl oligopeptidase n=1 Tax=Goodfellowiella coeruleoviolacea TaxID=334858 RepID=A0AAE3GFV9_9PSEU|nr:prolyl oligopeptidase family serine peptidase [Goodfellowiella coeruleoviolacea]MCP2166632.1 prolyl oligopeptidase [Goodfellowiella coeruleoviolacea]
MSPTPTPRQPVTRAVGGITFTDPYDWLRSDTEESLRWQERQTAATTTALEDLPVAELAEAIKPALRDFIAGALGGRVLVGGRWFWLGQDDAGTGQAIRVSDDRDDPGRVVIDAARLTAQRGDGRPSTLVYLQPSPDGRLVAFSESVGGAPFGVYRVVEVDSGHLLDVSVPTLQGNAALPAWLPDGSGFYLHGRAADGGHQLLFAPVAPGTPERPPVSFALADVPATVTGLVPQVSPDGRHVLVVTSPHQHVATMIGDERTGRWRPFTPEGFDAELHGDWLDDDTYVAIATDTPRGRLVAIPVATSTDPATWRELVPTGDLVLRGVQVVRGRLVVSALRDVSLDIRVHQPDGTLVGRAPLPPASASLGLVGPGRLRPPSAAFLFSASTFTTAYTTCELDVDNAALEVVEAGADLPGIVVEQSFATSADGTRVPYFVVARADLDRTVPQPTLVNAYGGFNLPWVPAFLAENAPFVQAGGVFVQASLRGGSEYGRDWYEAGRGRAKQHTFDDLRAVAEDLIARGIATPDRLAFHGASNGGLVAGVAITQQPDLWRAVVAQVPVLDVLEPVTDGPGAEIIRSFYEQEYGSPDNPEDAAAIHAYSPCHNVRDGVSYPAVFQIFGATDISCPVRHGRRFTAALQHATTSGHPVLLRVWDDVGHGSLDPEVSARQQAEWLAFVMRELGMSYPGNPT